MDQIEIPVIGLNLDDFSQNISLMHIISLRDIKQKMEDSEVQEYESPSEDLHQQSISDYGV